MNKAMAVLFALCAFGFFGLSQQDSYQAQDHGRFGNPVGPERTVIITHGDQVGYIIFGTASAVGCLYFIAKSPRLLKR